MANFSHMLNDEVYLLKSDGSKYEHIKANVQSNLIFISDISVPIEEGDKLVRILPNKLEEIFEVINRGYYQRMGGIDSHYQVKVRKASKNTNSSSTNINNFYGSVSNSQIQQNTVDSNQFMPINDVYDKKEELFQFLEILRNNISQIPLDDKTSNSIMENVEVVDKELKQQNTKSSVIKQSLATIRNILEGTTGSLIASGLIYEIGKLVS